MTTTEPVDGLAPASGDAPHHPAIRAPILRLVSLFALLCIVPLALLTCLTLHLAGQAVVSEVNARVRTTSAVTGVLLKQEIGKVVGLATPYTGRPALMDAMAGGSSSNFDNHAIELQLAPLRTAEPGIAGVSVADTSCRLTQVGPATPGLVGVDRSSKDWCTGVKTSSEGYQGIPLTITNRHGSLLIGGISGANGGIQVLSSVASDDRLHEMLAGRSGVNRAIAGNGGSLSAFAPVDGLGRTVIAEVPASDALASVHRLRSTVLGVAVFLGLVLLAGIVVLARALRLRREAGLALIERETRTGAILEAASDAFISMDSAGIITLWNRQAEETFGWTEAEALGRPLTETVITLPGRAKLEREFAHFLATGDDSVIDRRIVTTAIHRDGHEFPAELALWPVRLHDSWSFNAFIRDITERKRAETELAQARDQALEASRSKSDFLATMSHEIRTPMNGVIGLTGLLLDTDLTETQRHHAEGVRASGEALLGIINDILDFSKIEAGKLELETVDFDVATAIEEVAALVAESARAKGLELVTYCRPEVPAMLRGDVGRLRQILLNFATNAVKFTDNGEVVLRAGLAEPRAHGQGVELRFEVADTGIGVAPGFTQRLFEPFSQADAFTTRRYGGSGLGLAISRRLAEAMGGTVGVDSGAGVGSTFWVRLPLALASQTVAALPGYSHSLVGRRVLVVDDNQTNRLVLASQLRAWDVTADLAADATEALERLREAAASDKGYDMALLDMAMPGMDGMDLARTVRADPGLASVRLLLLSSISVEAAAATEAGFVARLTKPVRLSSLYDALVRAVTPWSTQAPRVPLPPAIAARLRGTLLIVEDHTINQDVAKGIAAKLGYGSDVAADGIEALEALNRRNYDAVLMDCHMPNLDGFLATAEIRRHEADGDHVPIIAMTASALGDDREKCIAAGMDDFLSKPIKAPELEAILDRWLGDTQATPKQESLAPPRRPVAAEDVLDAAQFDGLRQLAAASGDPGLLRSFVDQYLHDAGSHVTELRRCAAQGDIERFRQVAHGFGGTSATMGATGVAAACALVEVAAARGETIGPESLDKIDVEVVWAGAALRAEVPKSGA